MRSAIAFALALVVVAGSPRSAFADKGKGKHHGPKAFHTTTIDKHRGLPPGLAKRDSLPPGLARQLRERGRLPPGLQRRLYPVPQPLLGRLPAAPSYYARY